MHKTEHIKNGNRIVNIVLGIFASLFFVLAVYYIAWSIGTKENYSSVIVYSVALAFSFITIQQVIKNKKTFIVFGFLAVLFFVLGIFNMNVSSLFH